VCSNHPGLVGRIFIRIDQELADLSGLDGWWLCEDCAIEQGLGPWIDRLEEAQRG